MARLAAQGKLDEDIIAQQANELEQDASSIAGRAALLRVQIGQAQTDELPIEDIASACTLIAESGDAFTFEEKRWAVRTLIDTVYAGSYEEDGKSELRWWFEGKLPWVKLQWTDEIRAKLASFTETLS